MDYVEKLEQSIARSSALAKIQPKHFSINGLKTKEVVYIHGLRRFMGDYPEVEDKEIITIIKKHPHKFWVLKDLNKGYPHFLEELREQGSHYVCEAIASSRAITKIDKKSTTI